MSEILEKLFKRRGTLPLRYRVREHPRAKHVRLKLSWLGTLEVVVPRGYDQRHIPQVIEQKRDWLSSMQKRLELELSDLPPELLIERPTHIYLRALRRCYRVSYRTDPSKKPAVIEQDGRLIVQGAVQDPATLKALLCGWLHGKARLELPSRLAQAAAKYGFRYERVTVRGQKTRWGSCSSRGTISLNYKLLFVPRQLMEYLFVHELAHTRVFNHSPRYWSLVQSKLPDYERLDAGLKGSWRYVPLWAGI